MEYKRLKTQISESVYKELESFIINNANFTSAQESELISLIEKIIPNKTESTLEPVNNNRKPIIKRWVF